MLLSGSTSCPFCCFELAALLLAVLPAYSYGAGVPFPPPGAGVAAMAIGFVPPVPPLAGVPTSFSILEGMKLVYYVYLW